MKHIFYVYEDEPDYIEDNYYEAVVAETKEQALEYAKMPFGFADDAMLDADARDLPLGLVDRFEGLKRQIYGWIEDKCPSCDNPYKYAKLFWDEYNERIACEECYN